MKLLQVSDEVVNSLSVEKLRVVVSAWRAFRYLTTYLSNYVAWLNVPDSLHKLFHRTIVVSS